MSLKRYSKSALLTTAVIALVSLMPRPAQAVDFSLYGSYWDTDTDALDNAIGVGARVTFFGDAVQMEIGAAYYDEFGIDTEVIPADIGVRYNFRGSQFFLAGGGSIYFIDTNVADADDEYGLYLRGGFQFSSFFIEAGYRDVQGTIYDLDNLVTGIIIRDAAELNLSGPFVNMGWSF